MTSYDEQSGVHGPEMGDRGSDAELGLENQGNRRTYP
jgi:hypothetical protein